MLDALKAIFELMNETKPLGRLRVSCPPIGTLNNGVKDNTAETLILLATRSNFDIVKSRPLIKADEAA
jgi:hypothetical protein